MNSKDTYACMRAFSVGLSLLIDDGMGLCIQLNEDSKDKVFSGSKLIIYKLGEDLKVAESPKHLKHGQLVKMVDKENTDE